MSPVELAKQDAKLMDSSVLTAYQDGDVANAENRDFVRAFVGKLAARSLFAHLLKLKQDGRVFTDGKAWSLEAN